jgi:hypothetical protein
MLSASASFTPSKALQAADTLPLYTLLALAVYPAVVAAVIATRGYLINFFDLVYSVTTLEFNLIEAVLETFWRLRLPTTSRFELNVFSPSMVKSPLSSAAILDTFDEKSFTLEERMFVIPEPSPTKLVTLIVEGKRALLSVPELILSAFKVVSPEPSPDTEVVVKAPTFAAPWTSNGYPGLAVKIPTLF